MNQTYDAQKETGLKGVFFDNMEDKFFAEQWAARFGLKCLFKGDLPQKADNWELWLNVSKDKVQLSPIGKGAPGPIEINFEAPARRKRFTNAAHERNQPLAKAIGLHKGVRTVLDGTAGLGMDAQMFLAWGLKVTAVERDPILGALWTAGIEKCRDAQIRTALQNLKFINQDVTQVLKTTNSKWDVVYLDPMYPERKKGAAAVKKEMQIFRKLVGSDLDSGEVFELALSQAKKRVIVKRPKNASVLIDLVPDLQIKGTVVRFDIYLR